MLLVHTEVCATVLLEHIILFERTLVYKHFDTFTRCVFATCVLLLNGLLATTKTSLLALCDQFFDFFYLFAHIFIYVILFLKYRAKVLKKKESVKRLQIFNV